MTRSGKKVRKLETIAKRALEGKSLSKEEKDRLAASLAHPVAVKGIDRK